MAGHRLLLTVALLGSVGCASNLSQLQMARPVEPGHFQVTTGAGVYVPAGQMANVVDEAKDRLDDLRRTATDGEPLELSEEDRQRLLTLGLALAVFPPSPGYEISVRTGIVKDVDVGLRYSVSALRLDAKYRFFHRGNLGEEEEAELVRHIGMEPSGSNGSFDVALGLGVTKTFFDNPVFELLGYLKLNEFSRWDIEVPLYVSWEPNRVFKLYGGAKYQFGRVNMDGRLVRLSQSEGGPYSGQFNLPSRADLHFIGGTAGIGLGYRWVHLLLELTAGHASAKVPVFRQTRELGGLTLYPAAGLQLRF